ncbi:MAG TPA: hypothetical protein VG347_04300 [Verrucomicrobiae bacterium]|nr:hypothetical protein [Verrucomicrobiae bacterium]
MIAKVTIDLRTASGQPAGVVVIDLEMPADTTRTEATAKIHNAMAATGNIISFETK